MQGLYWREAGKSEQPTGQRPVFLNEAVVEWDGSYVSEIAWGGGGLKNETVGETESLQRGMIKATVYPASWKGLYLPVSL